MNKYVITLLHFKVRQNNQPYHDIIIIITMYQDLLILCLFVNSLILQWMCYKVKSESEKDVTIVCWLVLKQ